MLAAVALLLTGCAAKASPITNQPPAPTTQVASQTPTIAAEVMPTSLAKYRDMPVPDFAALPRPEHALYFSWLIRNMPQYVADYTSEARTATDIYTTPSIDNTPQQALANFVWIERLIVSLDPNDAQKAMIASVTEGIQSPTYILMNRTQLDVVDRKPQSMAASNTFNIDVVTQASELKQTNANTPYYDVTSVDTSSTSQSVTNWKLEYNTFKSYNGSDFSFWGNL